MIDPTKKILPNPESSSLFSPLSDVPRHDLGDSTNYGELSAKHLAPSSVDAMDPGKTKHIRGSKFLDTPNLHPDNASRSSDKRGKNKNDLYRVAPKEAYSGSGFGFDTERNQSFVEIYFGSSSIGDLSWVDGAEHPVLTFEANWEKRAQRFDVDQMIRALQDAVDVLGPREEHVHDDNEPSSDVAP